MFKLVLTHILRRRLRSALTVSGIAVAIAALLLVDQIAGQYRRQLLKELNSMGIHLMLVPLGCPYDAAARVLKGGSIETSLPEEAVNTARTDPNVEIAAPLLIVALPRADQGRTDMFVGLDPAAFALKSWWRAKAGVSQFTSPDSVILGSDAAHLEMRDVGDALFSPETGATLKVAGILEPTGTSDDSMFFVPLKTAQAMFKSPNRITAVAIRLRDPAALQSATTRLQEISGAQVVTQTEMMGTFLTILGTVRTLLQSVSWVALTASIAGLMNTLLMSVVERRAEFSLFRAIGASKVQVFGVVLIEALSLTVAGLGLGLLACAALGSAATTALAQWLPYIQGTTAPLTPRMVAISMFVGLAIALLGSLWPAWRASQVAPADMLKGAN